MDRPADKRSSDVFDPDVGRTMRTRELLLSEAERTLHLGTWTWDLDTNAVGWSEELFRILGYDPTRDEPSVEAFFAVVHPDDLTRVREATESGAARGEGAPLAFRVRRPDGRTVHVLSDAVGLSGPGDRARCLVGTLLDVTQRKRAERELCRSENILLEAQRIGRFGSWTWDPGSGQFEWSDGLYRILGVDPRTPPSSRLYRDVVHPEDRDRIRRLGAQMAETGIALQLEHRIVRPNDGRVRHLRVNSKPMMVRGQAAGFVGTIVDVTETYELEAKLTSLTRMRQIGLEMARVTHDLTNNLMAAHAFCHSDQGSESPLAQKLDESVELVKRLRALGELLPGDHEAGSQSEAPPGPLGEGRGILLLEDDPHILSVLSDRLVTAGYQVFPARSGPEARRTWQENRGSIHGLIADLFIPEREGHLVARELRLDAPNLPVILMTAYPTPPKEDLGPAMLLRKPFTPDELLRRVRRLLSRPVRGARS